MRTSKKSLSIILPRLALDTQPSLAALVKVAQHQPAVAKDFYQQLWLLFGYSLSETIACAALSALADNLPAQQGYWLCCDLIQLRADLAAVFCLPNRLALTATEQQQLQTELTTYFTGQQLNFKVSAKQRWYLQLPTDPEILTYSFSYILGKDISAYLPNGLKRAFWRAIMTELQMLLHQSAVNQQRLVRGQAAVNGVWIWGEGKLPDQRKTNWNKVWSDEPVSTGLAILNGVTISELPALFTDCLTEMQHAGDYLMVFDQQMTANRIENYIAEIALALKACQLDEVKFYGDSEKMFSLTAKQFQAWWRRWFL